MIEPIDEREPTDRVSTPPPANEPRPDLLWIFHLLLWTGVTAMLLASYWNEVEQVAAYSNWSYGYFALISGSISAGAALAGLVVFGLRWREGVPAISEPGHVLLLWLACIVSSEFAMNVLNSIERGLIDPIWPNWLEIFTRALMEILIFAGSLFVLRMERRWRGAFVVVLGTKLFIALSAFVPMTKIETNFVAGFYIYPLASALWMLIVLACISCDIWSGTRRDWLHWIGVGASTVFIALQTLTNLVILRNLGPNYL